MKVLNLEVTGVGFRAKTANPRGPCRYIIYTYIWGFPKIGGTILGVPIIRIIVFGGLRWGPLNLGNCHISVLDIVYTYLGFKYSIYLYIGLQCILYICMDPLGRGHNNLQGLDIRNKMSGNGLW